MQGDSADKTLDFPWRQWDVSKYAADINRRYDIFVPILTQAGKRKEKKKSKLLE